MLLLCDSAITIVYCYVLSVAEASVASGKMPAIVEKLLMKVTEEKRDIVKLLEQDPYGALCLRSQSCTAKDVKKAYRKLVLKYHPDKNKGVKTNDSFQAIQNAYELLRDPRRKMEYDNKKAAQTLAENIHSAFSARAFKGKRENVHVNDGTSSESEDEVEKGPPSKNMDRQQVSHQQQTVVMVGMGRGFIVYLAIRTQE
jgi:hypothetical protein